MCRSVGAAETSGSFGRMMAETEGVAGGVGWRSGLSRFNAACHGLVVVTVAVHTARQPNTPHRVTLALACCLLVCVPCAWPDATRPPVSSREARSGAQGAYCLPGQAREACSRGGLCMAARAHDGWHCLDRGECGNGRPSGARSAGLPPSIRVPDRSPRPTTPAIPAHRTSTSA